MFPLKIKSSDKLKLTVYWNDGSHSEIGTQLLRKECPCATCLAEREGQSKKYIPIYSENEISIVQIKIVGNYAISIFWKDGHSTGIYEFPYLQRLASSTQNKIKT
jgi:DUF971 family protein